jgi:cytochrome c556
MPLLRTAALSAAAIAAVMTFAALADDAPVFQVDPAIASMTPQQKVDAREAAMKEDGKLLQAAAKAGPGKDAVAAIDKVLQNFTNFPAWFSEDTKDIKSFALPVVWEQFDQFTPIFDKGKTALLAWRSAAAGKDSAAFKAAIGPVANVCGECHETYRASLGG